MWQKLLDIVLFLPRENLGLGPGKNFFSLKNSFEFPGISLSSVSEFHVGLAWGSATVQV